MIKILIVEDDEAIANLLTFNLKHANFKCRVAINAKEAEYELINESIDLILLDWMLPSKSGIELLKEWNKNKYAENIPIIMLTAKGEEKDKIEGLSYGADDYIVKPFSIKELLARINAVLRRYRRDLSQNVLQIGDLVIDTARWQIDFAGNQLLIGVIEFKLLNFLAHNPNIVHSRSQLLDNVWGQNSFIEERTVDVNIKRLRKALDKIGCNQMIIETVRGLGYKFNAQLLQKKQ